MWTWAVWSVAVAAEPVVESVDVGGFVESYWAWNFNDPESGRTALRGFDEAHNSFALSLASVYVGMSGGVLRGRVALQAGSTPRSYYATEPGGAGPLKHVREAWAGATAPVLGGLSIDGGVFLSPVGYDAIAVKDNRFWSLSNLGVGLPFYFTGVRLTQDFGQGTQVTAGVFNGWNRVTDDNGGKTVGLWALHTFPNGARVQGLYMGGVEQPGEDGPWRNTFDLWAEVPVGPVTILAGADAGFEPRDGGLHAWQAGQLAVDVAVHKLVTLGLRGDVFHERGPDGVAGHVFWPTELLGEVTGSVGVRPVKGLLARAEVRHDRAADPVFFGADPDSPTERAQTTVTLGVTGWIDAHLPTSPR